MLLLLSYTPLTFVDISICTWTWTYCQRLLIKISSVWIHNKRGDLIIFKLLKFDHICFLIIYDTLLKGRKSFSSRYICASISRILLIFFAAFSGRILNHVVELYDASYNLVFSKQTIFLVCVSLFNIISKWFLFLNVYVLFSKFYLTNFW